MALGPAFFVGWSVGFADDVIAEQVTPILFDLNGTASVFEWQKNDMSYETLDSEDVIIRHEMKQPEEGTIGNTNLRHTREVIVKRSVIDTPSTKKVVKIDSVEWSIESIADASPSMVRFNLIRKPIRELVRRGYRVQS